jgi:adenine-specific DNA methylase
MNKRFIEESFPVKEVSHESAREKNIRHGHISTLHIWWARRPLASSRATGYAALVPAHSDRSTAGGSTSGAGQGQASGRLEACPTLGRQDAYPTSGRQDAYPTGGLYHRRELIDVLHLVLLLWEKSRREEMIKLLGMSGCGTSEAFYRVAQAVSETLPVESKEKKLLDGFLTGRERVREEVIKGAQQERLFT